MGFPKCLKNGAGDGVRTRDVQLGKTTVNCKQRTLRFLHVVLAIQFAQFSPCASARLLTEHKRSTRLTTPRRRMVPYNYLNFPARVTVI